MDAIPEIIRVLKIEEQALSDYIHQLQTDGSDLPHALQKAFEACQASLEGGGKIVVMGVGKSGKIGQKIVATLCSTGSQAVFLHAFEGLHGDVGVVRSGDVVLALSYTGNTEQIIDLLPTFKERGVPVIGIGGNAQSRLTAASTIWVHTPVAKEACPHNLAPTASTTLMLAIGDALALALMKSRGFDSQSFAQNHPGGSLGKKLTLKVKDLMHTGDQLAIVQPGASMDEVVVLATQKKLGAVLVMEKNILLGIITDGDLRRSLQHREKFFQMKANEVMTRSPVTASPEMPVQTALDLMENRASQITSLPVVDEQGYGLGIIRLHDLVRSF